MKLFTEKQMLEIVRYMAQKLNGCGYSSEDIEACYAHNRYYFHTKLETDFPEEKLERLFEDDLIEQVKVVIQEDDAFIQKKSFLDKIKTLTATQCQEVASMVTFNSNQGVTWEQENSTKYPWQGHDITGYVDGVATHILQISYRASDRTTTERFKLYEYESCIQLNLSVREITNMIEYIKKIKCTER